LQWVSLLPLTSHQERADVTKLLLVSVGFFSEGSLLRVVCIKQRRKEIP
jgi:hypothetical protein